jgi:hypothetical protein
MKNLLLKREGMMAMRAPGKGLSLEKDLRVDTKIKLIKI